MRKIIEYAIYASLTLTIWLWGFHIPYGKTEVSSIEIIIIVGLATINLMRICVTKEVKNKALLSLAIMQFLPVFVIRNEKTLGLVATVLLISLFLKNRIARRRSLTYATILLFAISIVSFTTQEKKTIDAAVVNRPSLESIKAQKSDLNAMDNEEKLRLVGEIISFECNNLGIPDLKVSVSNLTEAAHYKWGTREVVFDIDVLENASFDQLVFVCAHESYHALQFELTGILKENPRFSDLNLEELSLIQEYQNESLNYVSFEENRSLYEKQLLEIKANEYAQTRRENYNSKD